MISRILDERDFLHRYKATSHAGVVMAVSMAALFLYSRLHDRVIRWDLLAVMGAGALTETLAMIYFRRTE